MKKVRITNIYKFVRGLIVLFGGIVFIIALLSNASFSHNKNNIEYKTLNVINGDTLWNIAAAEQENNPYYEGKDIRSIICNIKKVNSLESSNLTVGEELKIPVI